MEHNWVRYLGFNRGHTVTLSLSLPLAPPFLYSFLLSAGHILLLSHWEPELGGTFVTHHMMFHATVACLSPKIVVDSASTPRQLRCLLFPYATRFRSLSVDLSNGQLGSRSTRMTCHMDT